MQIRRSPIRLALIGMLASLVTVTASGVAAAAPARQQSSGLPAVAGSSWTGTQTFASSGTEFLGTSVVKSLFEGYSLSVSSDAGTATGGTNFHYAITSINYSFTVSQTSTINGVSCTQTVTETGSQPSALPYPSASPDLTIPYGAGGTQYELHFPAPNILVTQTETVSPAGCTTTSPTTTFEVPVGPSQGTSAEDIGPLPSDPSQLAGFFTVPATGSDAAGHVGYGYQTSFGLGYGSPNHTITVTDAGTGSGTVTSSPAGISCGTSCVASFASPGSVTLTAAPTAGSTFAGWSGACTGSGSCALNTAADTAVTATFTARPVTIALSTSAKTITSDGMMRVTAIVTNPATTPSAPVTVAIQPGTPLRFATSPRVGTSLCAVTGTGASCQLGALSGGADKVITWWLGSAYVAAKKAPKITATAPGVTTSLPVTITPGHQPPVPPAAAAPTSAGTQRAIASAAAAPSVAVSAGAAEDTATVTNAAFSGMHLRGYTIGALHSTAKTLPASTTSITETWSFTWEPDGEEGALLLWDDGPQPFGLWSHTFKTLTTGGQQDVFSHGTSCSNKFKCELSTQDIPPDGGAASPDCYVTFTGLLISMTHTVTVTTIMAGHTLTATYSQTRKGANGFQLLKGSKTGVAQRV